ncbi:YceD family protein [Pseudochrobactrum asaccharolyticum]|uniref:YceD family protein n=1 Tax=Pseudochrobactrum asaccharolyticum TaxID=354351 RepID=UPI00404101EB
MTKYSGAGTAGLSYPVSVAHVPGKGITVKVEADDKERAQLAENHELLSVGSFTADFLITPWKKDGIRLRGHIEAQIVQACVATLEPIETQISEDVDTVFVPENSRLARIRLDESGEMLIDAEGPDMPETFEGDRIDIGSVAEEFFELAIDPYPRKTEADYIEIITEDDEEGEDEVKPDSPFAGLAKLRDKN